MSRTNRKKRVESKETVEEPKEAPKRDLKPVMNFDAYFQSLMSEKKVQIHHKAPMRKFAQKAGIDNGTKAEFDKVFKLY